MREPKAVLVTGAEGALGQAVARRFVKAGCKVFGTYLPSEKGVSLPDSPGVQWVGCNVADSGSVRGVFAGSEAQIKVPVEAVVHCVGGFRFARADQTTDEDLDFLIDANFRSACLVLREILPSMKERDFGRVVLVSARATLGPTAGMSAYCATKAGINALVAALNDELKDHDINVNAVLPSILDTPANRRDMPKADFGKWVGTERLAEVIFSLTQPWGAPIRGALIPVAGRA